MTMTVMPPDNRLWLQCIERVLAELKHPPLYRPARSAARAGADPVEPGLPTEASAPSSGE
jgi:hypothetical protein